MFFGGLIGDNAKKSPNTQVKTRIQRIANAFNALGALKNQSTEGRKIMKIDWKRKLTSRKFWMAVASFVSMLVIAFGGTQEASSQVAAIIIAGATVVAYIIGEGLTDQSFLSSVGTEYLVDSLKDADHDEK